MTAKVGAKGRIPGRIFPRFDARTMRAVTRPPSIPFQTTSMPITRAICGDRTPFYAHGPRAHQATPASCPADVNGPMLRMMTTGHVCSDWGWLAGERLAVWPSSGRDRYSLCESTLDRSALIVRKPWGPAERLALSFLLG